MDHQTCISGGLGPPWRAGLAFIHPLIELGEEIGASRARLFADSASAAFIRAQIDRARERQKRTSFRCSAFMGRDSTRSLETEAASNSVHVRRHLGHHDLRTIFTPLPRGQPAQPDALLDFTLFVIPSKASTSDL